MASQDLTDAGLVVLSLICEHPLHGYQIEQIITERNMRAWTDLSSSSIYYLLQRLEHKGLIERMEPGLPVSGLPRKVYQITAAGRLAWEQATLQALAHPRITYTNFLMGLHNLWNIPAAEAAQAVQTYYRELRDDLGRQRREFEGLGLPFFPVDVLFEYSFALGEAELAFLQRLIDRLEERARSTHHAEPGRAPEQENGHDNRAH